MTSDASVTKNSMTWIATAGVAAVCLSFFLYYIDNVLTFSDKEQKLGETLYELRSAQAEVSPGLSDSRQMPIALTQVQEAPPSHSDGH